MGERRPTAAPYSDRITLSLGRKQVELIYIGQGHLDNLIVMNFLVERTVFAVNIVGVKRLAYKTLATPTILDKSKRLKILKRSISTSSHLIKGRGARKPTSVPTADT